MHSSQKVLLQQGVRTASFRSFEQIGHAKVLSVTDFSRISSSVNPLVRPLSCFSQDALKVVRSQCFNESNTYLSGCAMTSLPSDEIITPPPALVSPLSTVFKKLLGMPVVLLSLGLPSNSLSLLVGQS